MIVKLGDAVDGRWKLIKTTKGSIEKFQNLYADHHVNVYRKSMFWKFFQRRRTVRALHQLHDLMVSSAIFLHHFRNLKPGDDYKEMIQYHYEYMVKLADCKTLIIKGLNYNKRTDSFSRKYGEQAWNNITTGLVLPEIKQIGVRG